MPCFEKKISIGLIGFGFMGKTHAYCVDNLKYFFGSALPFDAKIVGLCTTDFERTKKLCQDYGIECAYTNEDEMIDDAEIDVIDICTPNALHYETLKKAIIAGKSVYCEKPLCLNLEQTEEIVELSKKTNFSGALYGIVFNNRFMSAIMRAKQIIDEGKLGRILSFSFSYLHNSCTFPERPAGWKQNFDVCGGGVGFDLGSHVIDLVHYLCGRIKSVSAHSQIAFPERLGADGKPWRTNADEAFYITAVLEGGACGTITSSKLATGENDGLYFEIYGERGALKFSLMEPNWLYFYDTEASDGPIGGYRGFTRIECVGRYPAPAGAFPSPKASTDWLRGHVQSMYTFLSSVAEKSHFYPDLDDALAVAKVLDAAYRSASSGSAMTEVLL